MKAISTIIGAVLMLIIALGLVGITYTFVSGVFTSKTSTAFSIVDAYSDTVTISNIGAEAISGIQGSIKGDPVTLSITPSPVPPGQTATIKPASPLTQGTHILRLCTSSMCNTAVLTIIEALKRIITAPLTIIPSVIAAGPGGILFQNSTGSDLAIITDSGNVGIGTTGPGAKFAVEGTDTEIANFFDTDAADNENNFIWVGKDASNFGYFGYHHDTTDGDRATFLSVSGDNPAAGVGLFVRKGGNVGIGTTNPTALLSLSSTGPTIQFNETDVGTDQKTWTIDTLGGVFGIRSWNDGKTQDRAAFAITKEAATNQINRIAFFTGNEVEAMRIDNASRVGIGTTGPGTKLHVGGLTDGGIGFLSTGVQIDSRANLGVPRIYRHASGWLTLDNIPGGGDQLVLASGGNVGIGTTGPGFPLEVRKTGAGIQEILALDNSRSPVTAGDGSRIVFSNTAIGGRYGIITAAWETGAGPGNEVSFMAFGTSTQATGAREVVRITSGGNVGIGTAGPAPYSGTGNAGLSIGFNTATFSGVGSQPTVAYNAYFDGSWKYVAAGYATRITQGITGTRAIDFDVSPSGTAGNAITFTNAMSIDTSGKVGIGTTSPGEKLHINNGNLVITRSTSGAKQGLILMNSAVARPACDATTQGAITYEQNLGPNNGNFFGCKGSGGGTFSWVQLN